MKIIVGSKSVYDLYLTRVIKHATLVLYRGISGNYIEPAIGIVGLGSCSRRTCRPTST